MAWGGDAQQRGLLFLRPGRVQDHGHPVAPERDEQARVLPGKSFQANDPRPRNSAYIKTAAPGSLLFTPYHVMMVLGNSNGTPYMIHSLASYGMETSSGVVKNRIMQVVVSKVDLMAGSGTPLVDQMTQCNTWR